MDIIDYIKKMGNCLLNQNRVRSLKPRPNNGTVSVSQEKHHPTAVPVIINQLPFQTTSSVCRSDSIIKPSFPIPLFTETYRIPFQNTSVCTTDSKQFFKRYWSVQHFLQLYLPFHIEYLPACKIGAVSQFPGIHFTHFRKIVLPYLYLSFMVRMTYIDLMCYTAGDCRIYMTCIVRCKEKDTFKNVKLLQPDFRYGIMAIHQYGINIPIRILTGTQHRIAFINK